MKQEIEEIKQSNMTVENNDNQGCALKADKPLSSNGDLGLDHV